MFGGHVVYKKQLCLTMKQVLLTALIWESFLCCGKVSLHQRFGGGALYL